MREFLFRGKRKDNGEWIIRDNIAKCAYEVDDETKALIEVYSYYLNGVVVDAKTVGQYTGLTDKNGKKIFEGDIFRPFDNEIIVVAWIDYYSTLGFLCRVEHTETKRGKEITESYDGWAMLCDYELSELEVIGNIHDNPELLKGGGEE